MPGAGDRRRPTCQARSSSGYDLGGAVGVPGPRRRRRRAVRRGRRASRARARSPPKRSSRATRPPPRGKPPRSLTEISSGTLALTFEAPGFVAPISVTSETTIYRGPTPVRGPTPEAEAQGSDRSSGRSKIRVNGVPFDAKGGVPRLPIIEPERVAAPPLAITLSDVYRYRLAGRETVHGRELSTSSPSSRARRGESLFKGRVWIDAQTFGIVRASATQTGLKGPITASEQTDEFERDAEGRWLLARSDIRQTYEGASVRTPIHRLLIIDRHDINPPDFTAQRNAALRLCGRDAARHSGRLPLPRSNPEPKNPEPENPEPGTPEPEKPEPEPARNRRLRVLAGRSERIRTVAFGVIIDPNISRPAAVRRTELRRLQPVRDRHAVQRLLRRQLRPARVLGAVDPWHALAARRPCVRHRVVVQRPRLRERPRAVSRSPSGSGPRRPRCGCCVRCPRAPRSASSTTGTTTATSGRTKPRRSSSCRATRTRTGSASALEAQRRRVADLGVGQLRPPRRLATVGPGGVDALSLRARRLPALRRLGAALRCRDAAR